MVFVFVKEVQKFDKLFIFMLLYLVDCFVDDSYGKKRKMK
jgi:hypothetical protein